MLHSRTRAAAHGARHPGQQRFRVRGAVAGLILCLTPTLPAQTADQIITRMEAAQVVTDARQAGRMIATDRFGEREITFVSFSDGADRQLIEFTSAAEAGQKILRLGEELFLFYPDADELIRVQGAALRDAVLGSDVSYEDLTGEGGLLLDYAATRAEDEVIDGRPMFVVELEAVTGDVAYASQRIWIDQELLYARRSELYARNGRLIKTVEALEVRNVDGRNLPVRIRIEDRLRRNTATEFILDEIQLNADLDPRLFSVEGLAL